jgi:hypothetical protein
MLLLLTLACHSSSPDLASAVALPSPAAEDRKGIAAHLTASATSGDYPLTVAFDASSSRVGGRAVAYHWDFGDGSAASGAKVVHTYVGPGLFDARISLLGGLKVASAAVAIDVGTPSCPVADPAVVTGNVDDGDLDEISGVAASPTDPDAYWVEEDSGNLPILVAVDDTGATLARHALPDSFTDWEDLSAALDPSTGDPMLFLADIGDNGYSRSQIAVWVLPEPDTRSDGDVTALRMGLTYPDGPHNAETLLVDPLTLDVYIVTKETGAASSVYVKRAPHDSAGPFVLESVGTFPSLTFTATGGDISPDGTQIVVRDYTSTAHLFERDGYAPLEDAFAGTSCPIAIHSEQQGEAIGFTADGTGLVTMSEGLYQPMYYIGL